MPVKWNNTIGIALYMNRIELNGERLYAEFLMARRSIVRTFSVVSDISSESPSLLYAASNSVTRLFCSTTQPQQELPKEEEAVKANVEDDHEEEDDDDVDVNKETGEVGGPKGPEPTRFGDWERNGRCSDF
ncbi:hypothetical protein ACFE04_028679 [Oxalis oulophora]